MNIPEFETSEAAINWIVEQADDPCVDNTRFAFDDDSGALLEYEWIKEGGCCGFMDREVLVAGRRAWVGCNYGH